MGGTVRSRAADAPGAITGDAPPTEAFQFVNSAANVVAQYAAGAPLADTTGPFVVATAPRTMRIVLGSGGANPTVFTVTGTDPDGTAITETITAAGAGTYEGARLFQTVTAFASDVNPGGTTDLRCSANGYSPSTRFIHCGGAGNLVVRPMDGAADVTYVVISGQVKRIRAKWISLATSATGVVAER